MQQEKEKALEAIRNLIAYYISDFKEGNGYTGKQQLIYLTPVQAEIALRYRVPIGVRGSHYTLMGTSPGNRVVFFCDELGTMPPFNILPLFSAGRSRKLTLVPIIQSLAQLEKNYGKEGSEILQDNCQDTIFGGFAPNSQTAEVLSKALGNQTVQGGYISKAKDGVNQSLQMMGRPLMTPDELKAIPKGSFIVMKTGTNPMRTRLRLFLDWGITFGEAYQTPEHGQRKVYYADRRELETAILKKYPPPRMEIAPQAAAAGHSRSHQSFRKSDGDASSLRT